MTFTRPAPTPAQLLAEAETALHKRQLGRLPVELDFDGRRTKFAHTDIDALEGYVAKLRDLASGRRRPPGAIGFLL